MDSFKTLKPEAKRMILIQMQASQSSVYFKFLGSGVYKTRARPLLERNKITCPRPAYLPVSRTKRQVTMNFVINSEVYFMVTTLVVGQKDLLFSTDADVMVLARRKDFRLKMPRNFEGSMTIKRVGGQTTILRGNFIDMSSGGCQLGINSSIPIIAQGDLIEGSVRIRSRNSFDVKGVVKYHRKPLRGTHKQVFGIKYVELPEVIQAKLQTIFFELQRELFLSTLEEG